MNDNHVSSHANAKMSLKPTIEEIQFYVSNNVITSKYNRIESLISFELKWCPHSCQYPILNRKMNPLNNEIWSYMTVGYDGQL